MTRRIRGEGSVPAVSLWAGLGPGIDEERKGRPWVGRAGQLLDSILWKENLSRADFFLTNIRQTMIQKGDGGPYAEIEAFEYDLMRVEPQVVVPMGREVTQYFLGDVDMEAVHGLAWRIPEGHWKLAGTPPVVVPMYNPAFALHDAEAYTYVAWDVHQVKRVLDGEVAPREIRDQYPHPNYKVGFVDYPRHRRIYIDTEGHRDRPWCLTYCCVPGIAHLILATDKAGLRKFQELLDGMDVIVMHSAIYDLEVLRAMGVYVDTSKLADTKVKAYVGGNIEPQGLKALGFRHAGMRMKSYTDLTWEYDFAQAYLYLEKAAQYDWGKPDPIMEMRDGKPYVKKPQPVNTRINSIFNAIIKDEPEEGESYGVDPRARWFKIDAELREPIERELGPMPEFTLDCVPLKDAVVYACSDADATCRVDEPLDQTLSDLDRQVYNTDIAALPIIEAMQANGMRVQPGYFENLAGFFNKEMIKIRKQIEEFNGGKYVNPNSPLQMAELLFNRLRLPILKMTPKRKPSTSDKVLEALRGRHPVPGLTCEYREVATLKDKFANKLPKFVQADGRVRGKIRDTTVVSGRYSMSEPNLMAIPVRTKIGKKIRMGFIPEPGYVLCGADFDQIELRVMAHLGKDKGMIAAFNEGRDVHAETASLVFKIPLDKVDPLLHRYPAKRIGFGIATGITELGLYDQMYLAGITTYTVADCADMIRDYLIVRAGIQRMIDMCRGEALKFGYVRDLGGRIRYLPGVYSTYEPTREEALRQSHSHKVSGTAQYIKKRALARIWDEIQDMPTEIKPLLEIHDEVILEVKEDKQDWTRDMLIKAMSADSGMFAVPIKAKVNFGPTWGHLKD